MIPVGITKRTSENYRYAKFAVIATGNRRIIPDAVTGGSPYTVHLLHIRQGGLILIERRPEPGGIHVDRIRELRIDRGLSQTDLAALAGLNKSRICNIESGKANPNLSTLQAVADAMLVEVYDLLVRPATPRTRRRPASQRRETARLAS
jgi:DNA-binding XRE family transcriptional regulator